MSRTTPRSLKDGTDALIGLPYADQGDDETRAR
jgi:hypothetical protein